MGLFKKIKRVSRRTKRKVRNSGRKIQRINKRVGRKTRKLRKSLGAVGDVALGVASFVPGVNAIAAPALIAKNVGKFKKVSKAAKSLKGVAKVKRSADKIGGGLKSMRRSVGERKSGFLAARRNVSSSAPVPKKQVRSSGLRASATASVPSKKGGFFSRVFKALFG